MPPSSLVQSTCASTSRSAAGPCMPATSGHEAGGVGERGHLHHGLGAVDELHQHARIHVARPGLLGELVGGGVDLEGVVLGLAGGDDLEAERLGEADQLDGGRRLVARRAGQHDAGLLRLLLEVAADGDVGLDAEQHHMLAVADRLQRDEGAHVRAAGGIDHHIDAPGRAHRLVIVGHRNPPGLDDAVDIVRGGGNDDVAAIMAGHQRRIDDFLRAALAHRADAHTRHQRRLHHEIGAHLPGPDEAEGDRPVRRGVLQPARRRCRCGRSRAGRTSDTPHLPHPPSTRAFPAPLGSRHCADIKGFYEKKGSRIRRRPPPAPQPR